MVAPPWKLTTPCDHWEVTVKCWYSSVKWCWKILTDFCPVFCFSPRGPSCNAVKTRYFWPKSQFFYATPFFWAQTDPTQWNHISPISWGRPLYGPVCPKWTNLVSKSFYELCAFLTKSACTFPSNISSWKVFQLFCLSDLWITHGILWTKHLSW